ncbi:Ubiquitin carboxyl-terminal hydrolase family protein [Leishmania donovani]|uniref:Ubiquitin carboxyl-terminal hydrolase family protein n=1 Tax=Leishmania donovani TaxID=5661 RepID=A0A504Y424_LEIDO|nr:Ubiquitin carboxyl-terminal hydrolase family protein [Leishmania donovani]
MNCLCDHPARYLISRDGKPCYTCALGRCRFYALAPVQCEGYTRVTLGAPGCPLADTGVVLRFEALVHPTSKDVACFMIRVQGEASRWDTLRLAVLQDSQFEGMWYTAGRAFLYPMAQYTRLVAALKARSLPHVAFEEIPSFYFRCVERMRQLPRQYADDVAAGRACLPDAEDCVYRRLKPFQRDGVRFVLERHGRAMIADDMGLGKTVQAIAVAHHYRDEWPVLVVCPMSLMENWAKEFNKFCGIPFARIAILQGAKATATSLQAVAIVSYSSLKCVEDAHFNVVILDESHYIKAGAAKRAQQSLKLCRASRRVILLSGTPAMSRPIELYAQLQAIQPSLVPSKAQFGARYCNSFVGRFGIDMTGHAHPDELHSLLRHFLIRRTKRELGSELPSKSRQLLYMYITEKEKKALEKQIIALRRSLSSTSAAASSSTSSLVDNGGGDSAARAPNVFEMKMATARAKIPAVQDYVSGIVEQHLDSGEKLILFAHHQCMMEALRSAVEAVRPRQPIDYIYISGDTPPAQREPAAEHFRTEATCTVAILSMQSSGIGHNFTCASTVVFTELDWNPSTHLQCEDRVHRIGQAQPCHIKYLLAEGTSDSVIWPLLQTKLSVTAAMFETSNVTGAEVRLHDGADKQNVVRRDVVAATTSSTPSASQQSTLDQFMQPQPSQAASRRGEEVDGVVVSMQESPRVSVHSHNSSASRLPRLSASSGIGTTHPTALSSSLSTMVPGPAPKSANTTSVLDLMRRTSSTKSGAGSSAAEPSHSARAAAVSLVVDLTETASTQPVAMQPLSSMVSPPAPMRSLPSSSDVSLPTMDITASAGAVAPPRRTVFTLSKTGTQAFMNTAAASTLTSSCSGSRALCPAAPPALPVAPKTAAVHVPMRPDLHLKRPRTDTEHGSGGSTSKRVNTTSGDANALAATAVARVEVSCAAGPAAAATLAPLPPPTTRSVQTQPVMVHPIMLAVSSSSSSEPMDVAHNRSLGFAGKEILFRKIEFERYRKPHVVEYPRSAVVLNPQHTRQLRDAMCTQRQGATQLCSDAQFRGSLHLCWQAITPVGLGLMNLGNTCFANSVLQALAHTPAVAQYFMNTFRSADSQLGAPFDFAFALAETFRKMQHAPQQGRTGGGGAYRPGQIMSNLRLLSKHFSIGRQSDAHEFAVQLLFSCQKSLLHRLVGSKKVHPRVAHTTALHRICGGYLLSQVTWSRQEEIQQLLRAGKQQEAMDLKMEAKQAEGKRAQRASRHGLDPQTLCSNTYDPFTILSVELAGHTLQHCLDKFCAVEELDGRSYLSPRQVGVRAKKKLSIHVPPPVFVIHVKRFTPSGSKINKHVLFPLELDITRYCTLLSSADCQYELNAVCVHEGRSIDYGHYYTLAKAPNGMWYEFNDSHVSRLSEDQLQQAQVYMLFYSRKPTLGAMTAVEEDGAVGQELSESEVQVLLEKRRAVQRQAGSLNGCRSSSSATAAEKPQLLSNTSGDSDDEGHAVEPTSLSSSKSARAQTFKRMQEALPTDSDSNSDDEKQDRAYVLRLPAQLNGCTVQDSHIEADVAPQPSRRDDEHDAPADGEAPLKLAKVSLYGGIIKSMKRMLKDGADGGASTDTTAPQQQRKSPNFRVGRNAVQALHQRKVLNTPETVRRPASAPKFQQRIRDPMWEMEMDRGKVKKVKSKEKAPDPFEGVNPFQEVSRGMFDVRGRRRRA